MKLIFTVGLVASTFSISACRGKHSDNSAMKSDAGLSDTDRECGKVEVLPSTFGNFYQLNNDEGTFGITDNVAPFATSSLSDEMSDKFYCFDVTERQDFGVAKAIEISAFHEITGSDDPTESGTKCGEWEPLLTISGWNYNLRISAHEAYSLADDHAPLVQGGFAPLNNYRGSVCVEYASISDQNVIEVSALTLEQ